MGRRPCCAKEGLNKGAWTAMEDKILADYIKLHGEGRWRSLPTRAGLKRCGKSCRLRWMNYLRPDIKRGNFTDDEEDLIIRLHKLLGNRWSLIAGRLPGRADNEIKNYWNTYLTKKLQDHQPHQESKTKRSYYRERTTNLSATTQTIQPQSSGPIAAIRTKAVKGTRGVFINPPPPPPPPPPPQPLPPPPCNDEIMGPADPFTRTNASTISLVLSDGVPESQLLEDFLATDFSTMGELDFSEFLDSPQTTCYEFNQELSNEGGQFSQSSSLVEEPIVFNEEITVENWWRSGCDLDTSIVEYLLGE